LVVGRVLLMYVAGIDNERRDAVLLQRSGVFRSEMLNVREV